MSKLNQLELYLENWTSHNYVYTPVIGLARSVIAMGTLLTLLSNKISYLMPQLADGTILNPLLNPMSPVNKYNFFLILGTENVVIMKWLAILFLLAVILGYLPQVTSFLHWWISISFVFFSAIIDGGDQIAAVLTFLLIPLCLTDPRANHWSRHAFERRSPLNLVGLFSHTLIRLQVAIIYLHAATGKFVVTEWMNGTAIYYWFSHSVFGMQPWLEAISFPILKNDITVTLLTYSVLIFELTLFLAFTMSKRIRLRLLPFALAFHFFIILYHGIFSFFFSIAAGLIIYLTPLSLEFVKIKKWAKMH